MVTMFVHWTSTEIQLSPDHGTGRILIWEMQRVARADKGWDSKARVWDRNSWETKHILDGHTASVWAVLVLNEEIVVTGTGLPLPMIFLT